MRSDGIRGVLVPVATPLTADETVDTVSLRRLVNYVIDNGVHGIWAAGTNGEFAALSDRERLTAIETVVDEVADRVPVIANISAPSTQLSVTLGLSVQEWGIDGIAATPPYYYNVGQDELMDHYRRIRDRVGLPLWVYNIPVNVKIAVEPETVVRLAGEGTVVGVKDSSGAGEALAQLNVLCEQGGVELYRFLGSVHRATIARHLGAHGVIPGIANVVPGIAARAWEAGEAGDREAARELRARLAIAARIRTLATGGGPDGASFSGIKSALKLLGVIDDDRVTAPLRNLTAEEKGRIPGILKELDLIE